MAEKEAASVSRRKTYTLDEVAEFLGVARLTVERQCLKGTLPSIKVGTRRLVPVEAFDKFMAGTWKPEPRHDT